MVSQFAKSCLVFRPSVVAWVRNSHRAGTRIHRSMASLSRLSFDSESSPRILCYGDSGLTAGFTEGGAYFKPYSKNLAKIMGCKADAIGFCGFTTEDLHEVMEEEMVRDPCGLRSPGPLIAIAQNEEDGKPYSHAVVWAGANDLDSQGLVDFSCQLSAIHEAFHSKGITTTALTVMRTMLEAEDPGMAEIRHQMNERIKAVALARSANMSLLDIAEQLDRIDPSAKFLDDGVHLTQGGYELVGELVALHLLSCAKA